MCELLGLNANVPTDICFSFSGLMQRGGHTGPHSDGWGIVFYDGNGCRAFHDPGASASSEIAKMLRNYSIKSRIVVCHIRRATHGRVCLENTHPFIRELWGRNWSFAHNGKLKGIKHLALNFYRPIGTTDSEYAFCWILDQLRNRFPKPPSRPQTLWNTIHKLTARLDELGIFNMLMSDSRSLYSYCGTDLAWLTRKAPFGRANLVDAELSVDFRRETGPEDVVTIIATRPLTEGEPWNVMEHRTFGVFNNGKPRFI